jgi:nucleotide-binding universal stress UspA family protein
MNIMATILCATRGGAASIRTQEYAIAQAKERRADIVFFFVFDVKFLSHTGAPIMLNVVATELEHMGEFLLLMAKERAEKAGVQASTLTKHGVFREALIKAAEEIDAQLIILGSPGEGGVTEREHLERLIALVQETTGIDTVIAGD